VNLASPTDYLNVFKTTTRTQWDLVTPIALAGLGLFGVAFIYSAQLSVNGEDWQKQLIFLVLGAAVYTAVSLVDYRFWLTVAHWFYVACLVPLVLVLFLNNAQNMKWGAHRWIDLGFFSFQPSETAKIAVLLITASLLIRSKIGTVTQSLGTLGKLALAVGAAHGAYPASARPEVGDCPAPDGVFHALRVQAVGPLLRGSAGRVPLDL
jgi:rod shape determining protein RodA